MKYQIINENHFKVHESNDELLVSNAFDNLLDVEDGFYYLYEEGHTEPIQTGGNPNKEKP